MLPCRLIPVCILVLNMDFQYETSYFDIFMTFVSYMMFLCVFRYNKWHIFSLFSNVLGLITHPHVHTHAHQTHTNKFTHTLLQITVLEHFIFLFATV